MRMVHLRTVPDIWEANVLAARLGSEGFLTELRANLCRPYSFGVVSVLVAEPQAEMAAELLLADEVESAFTGEGAAGADGADGTEPWAAPLRGRRARYLRLLAALAALLVAGAPVLAHFVG
jgi:hypothetical protein